MDVKFLVPTSNMCERIFSIAGHAISDRRERILPANFEMYIFLHFNRDFWGLEDVNNVSTQQDLGSE